jgi:hypothetical protein
MPARGWPLEEATLPPSSESSAARDLLDDKWKKTAAPATMRTVANAYRWMPDLVNIAGLLVCAQSL